MTSPRFIGIRALLCILVAACALVGAPAANAALPEPLGATWTGWAYATSNSASTGAWKWDAAGWQSATVATGTAVWVQPWGSGWTWVWTADAWHAMQTTSLSTWSCTGANNAVSLTQAGPLRSTNSTLGASTITNLGAGTALTLLCSNRFADAARSGSEFALVRTGAGATGYVPALAITGAAAPVSGRTVPTSIDPTGASDVTGALQSFLDASPNGSTNVLQPGATYRTNRLRIEKRSNLTIEGQGARLWQSGRSNTEIVDVRGASGLTIRNLVIEGTHPNAGTGACWDVNYEHAHGISLSGATNVDIGNVTIRNMSGDGIYLTGSIYYGTQSNAVRIHDSRIERNGRMGIAITDGARNVTIDRNRFDRICYSLFDIEPNGAFINGAAVGGEQVHFVDNTITNFPMSIEQINADYGLVISVTGSSGGGPAKGLEIARNTITGWPFRVGVYNNNIDAADISVVANRSDTARRGPIMTFDGVAGLRVAGNVQPVTSGTVLQVTNSTGVTYV